MRNKTGFTLIELMIVVAIVGILAVVALPSYTRYIQEGHRADAQQYLLQMSGVLERNYTRLGQYPAVDAITFDTSDRYTFLYTRNSDTAFTLSASPKGSQADDVCGDMTLNQQGATTAQVENCWR